MKKVSTAKAALLKGVELSALERDPESRLAMASVPIPLGSPLPAGFAGLASQAVDIAWWPDSRSGDKRRPRRRLLFGLGGRRPLPDALTLQKNRRSGPVPEGMPEVGLDVDHSREMELLPHQSGELRLGAGSRTLGLRLGIRWKEEHHWWEWVRLEKAWEGPVVSAWRAGGVIEVVPQTMEMVEADPTGDCNRGLLRNKWLHNQNWLFAEFYLLCFANGVIHVTARFVNNHRVDEGREQRDLVPVIGLRLPASADPAERTLDGGTLRFDLGGVAVNLAEMGRRISREHPGRIYPADGLSVLQPWEGVEIEGDFIGRFREDRRICKAEDRVMPRGAARTVRFALGLGEAAPAITRYALPEWWQALSGELWPDDVLAVHDEADARLHEINAAFPGLTGRFDERVTATREGEMPYSLFLYYYRFGGADAFARALSEAYYHADLAFDHATETIRMEGHPFDGAIAPPLFRTVGLLFGYLETGDPYLLDCAESAASHWYWMDRHQWPRHAYGRDAASLRSLVFLWDYTGKEDYAAMAREAMGRLIQCQLPGGGYHDQGNGTGVHAISHLPVKPWMANMANDPILDFMLRRPERDPALEGEFRRYADFLVAAAAPHNGGVSWPYQLSYGEGLVDPVMALRGHDPAKGRMPTERMVVMGFKARALCVASRLTGNPAYFDLWRRFFKTHWMGQDKLAAEKYTFNKVVQGLSYAQAHSWNARWTGAGIEIDPLLSEMTPEMEGTLATPIGPVGLKVARAGAGRWRVTGQTGPAVTVGGPGMISPEAPAAGPGAP